LTGRLLAAIAIASALGACSSSDPRPTPSVLLPDVGPGYHLADATGPLSKEALAVATAVPKEAMSSYLRTAGWRSAAERVWTSTADGFVTDVVATFSKEDGATGLLALAQKTLPGPATTSFTPPGVAGARGFVQTSDVAGKTMFCIITFASSGTRAFVVTRCTPYPQDTTVAAHLLVQQLARAG
jgi:hypothetical protein